MILIYQNNLILSKKAKRYNNLAYPIVKVKDFQYNQNMEEGKKNTINILGINISTLKKNEVLEKIEEFLSDGKQHQIATPNPEIILKALQDEELFYILNNADLAVPDAMGVKIAGWLYGKNLKRITGADLVKDILKLAEDKNLKAVIFNWKKSISDSEEIKTAINKIFPCLNLMVETVGQEWKNYDWQKINEFVPAVVFTNSGASYQEKFVFHGLKKIPSAKLGMGVGGSFDFLTGKIARAPLIMRYIGLEWLWRLILEPWRIKRIYNAIFVFSFKFIKWKFWLPFFYRSNVVCLIFRKIGGRYKILLVERQNEPGHWQLPQGGTDGEDLESAGWREIKEEIGIKKIKIIKIIKNLYRYNVKPPHAEHTNRWESYGYKGQKQGLCVAEFLGRDEDIKINFWDHNNWKWINAENLASEVHPVRKDAAKIFLEKFNHIIHNT